MDTVVLVIRVLLAVVFLVAGIGKLLDRAGSTNALMGFGVPARLASLAGSYLPLVELATAIALIVQPSARWGAVVAVLLLLTFVGGIGNMLRQGLRPACHCFGVFHSEPASGRALFRNGGLLAIAIVAAAAGPGPSVTTWIAQRSTAELFAIALAIIAVALAAAVWRLRKTNERLQESLAQAEAVVDALPPGLPVGSVAPDFDILEARGGRVSLQSLLSRGNPVLLVFIGNGCMPSTAMLPDLARWQKSLTGEVTLALIGRGEPALHDYESRVLDMTEVGLQEDWEVVRAYRVFGTPSAVLISPRGRIMCSLAQASWAVEALLRLTLRGRLAEGSGETPVPAVSSGRV